MSDIADLVESISYINGVEGIVLTDETGVSMQFPNVLEDEEKAALTAFISSGVNSVGELLDLDEFQSVTINYEGGAMIVCPISGIYLGVMLSETKQLFKIESQINAILN